MDILVWVSGRTLSLQPEITWLFADLKSLMVSGNAFPDHFGERFLELVRYYCKDSALKFCFCVL